MEAFKDAPDTKQDFYNQCLKMEEKRGDNLMEWRNKLFEEREKLQDAECKYVQSIQYGNMLNLYFSSEEKKDLGQKRSKSNQRETSCTDTSEIAAWVILPNLQSENDDLDKLAYLQLF